MQFASDADDQLLGAAILGHAAFVAHGPRRIKVAALRSGNHRSGVADGGDGSVLPGPPYEPLSLLGLSLDAGVAINQTGRRRRSREGSGRNAGERLRAGRIGAVPRSNRPRRPDHLPLRSAAVTRAESGPDGEWVVRSVPGASSAKDYRCPGCEQLIAAGTGHLVAWPAGEHGSVSDRRHWHNGCWTHRLRRRPGGRR